MVGQPISAQHAGGVGTRIFMFFFFGIFFAAGAGFLYFIVARPVMSVIEARSWDAVPCEIVFSDVHVNSDSDGSTYRVDVRYRYSAGGQEHIGDRYRFVKFASSGQSGKTREVARLRANPNQTCWVNPQDPADSVLQRGLGWETLFGIIPLAFLLLGLGGMYGAVAGRSLPVTGAIPMLPEPQSHASFTLANRSRREPTRLKFTQSRRVKFFAFTLFALVWNGILSVFLVQLFTEWNQGIFSLFLALFLTPFVLVGAGVLIAAVYLGLQLTNPRTLLTVDNETVPLGDELEIKWLIDGAVEKLAGFSIELEGREEATYRRGTSTRTDKQVFDRILVTTAAAPVPASGTERVTIPRDSMHSFDARNNRIAWTLRVRGVIANWPDVDDEFAITVAPRAR